MRSVSRVPFAIATALCLLCLLILRSPSAQAACTLNTTPLVFGPYNPLTSATLTTVGSLSYKCGPGDRNIRITLSIGSGASLTNRQMHQGAQSLKYNLTLDPANTQVWGDGVHATTVYLQASVPPNTTIPVPIYAFLPAHQMVPPGAFRDILVATITWDSQ